MRAAVKIAMKNGLLPDGSYAHEMAAIIDAEMGLPELIEALKNIEINAAAPGIWHEWHKGVVLRLVRSALASVDAK
jgi:hypothetical protein